MESGYKSKAKNYHMFKENIMMGGGKKAVKDLDEYLDILHTIDRAQSSPTGVEKSVYNAFVTSFLAGCTYLELRFNPTKRSKDNQIDLDKIIVSARAGMERAKQNFGIEGGLILCMGRDCTLEANKAIFEKAKQYFGKGVKGIDLAGPYEYSKYKDQVMCMEIWYKKAKEMGMVTTIHAGEIDHLARRWELEWAINKLNVERIGHGIQIIKDSALMEEAAYKGTMFEVCISSNLATGAVDTLEEFIKIFDTFHRAGIEYQLCTDATFLLKTNIKKEYELYESIMGGPPPEY